MPPAIEGTEYEPPRLALGQKVRIFLWGCLLGCVATAAVFVLYLDPQVAANTAAIARLEQTCHGQGSAADGPVGANP